VGTAAVQLASRFGCTVFAMAGSAEKLERARELGAAAGVNYRQPGFQRALREVTGQEGVDVVLELVSGDVFHSVWPVLAPFGRVVVAGFASLALQRWNPLSWWRTWRALPRRSLLPLARGSHGLLATHLGYLLADPPRLLHVWDALTAFATRHGIRPVIGATLPFHRLPEAHRLLESRGTIGKIVVRT
jgi:NADPH2:quinone reductase